MKKIIKLTLVLGILFSLASCSKESLTSDSLGEAVSPLENLLKDYPKEINMSNWEEFVHAPKEVIDHFNKKELEKTKRPQLEFGPNLTSNRLVLGNILLGEIQVQGLGINPSTTYLGGTLVRITSGTRSTSSISSSFPFHQGQNVQLSNVTGGDICFYHKEITNGIYTAAEWANGLSGNDLVLIQKHILGIAPFTQVWQYMAADINGDGDITATDLSLVQNLILGNITSFPAIDEDYNQPVIYFPQIDYDGLQIPYIDDYINYSYFTLSCSVNGNGFTDRYAIKRGDLNGTWNY